MPRDPRSVRRLAIIPAGAAILLFAAVASAQNPGTYVTVVEQYAAVKLKNGGDDVTARRGYFVAEK